MDPIITAKAAEVEQQFLRVREHLHGLSTRNPRQQSVLEQLQYPIFDNLAFHINTNKVRQCNHCIHIYSYLLIDNVTAVLAQLSDNDIPTFC